MRIPEQINHRWIATLDNAQLVKAEAQLHVTFRAQEQQEKSRAGSNYMLLQGPTSLVTAWQRWSLINNEARNRGLAPHRHA